jgi:hypothetical protein
VKSRETRKKVTIIHKHATALICERIDGVEPPLVPAFLMASSSPRSRAGSRSPGPVPRSTIWSLRGLLRALLLSKVGPLNVMRTFQTRHMNRCRVYHDVDTAWGFILRPVLVGEPAGSGIRHRGGEVVWRRPRANLGPPRIVPLRRWGLLAE